MENQIKGYMQATAEKLRVQSKQNDSLFNSIREVAVRKGLSRVLGRFQKADSCFYEGRYFDGESNRVYAALIGSSGADFEMVDKLEENIQDIVQAIISRVERMMPVGADDRQLLRSVLEYDLASACLRFTIVDKKSINELVEFFGAEFAKERLIEQYEVHVVEALVDS